MGLITDILLDAARDTLSLVPFLFVTYLALELLEHAAGPRADVAVRRAGAAGPVVGAVLGVVPQCGFSAMGATLYAGRVVTIGTLVAVFLSTSDEMLPLLAAEQVDIAIVAKILLVKALVAAAMGLALDALMRSLRGNERVHTVLRRTVLGSRAGVAAAGGAVVDAAGGVVVGAGGAGRNEAGSHLSADSDLIDELSSAGESTCHIHELCERDHCGCDDDDCAGADGAADARVCEVASGCGRDDSSRRGLHAREAAGGGRGHDHTGHEHGAHGLARSVARSALSHTVQVSAFIFLVTFVLVAVLDTVGERALADFLAGNAALATLASGAVALIPNCAASVVITQLYLEGVLGFGPMLAGSLVAAGVGFLVLFRSNRSARENIAILLLLYGIGVAWGFLFTALGA